MRPERGRRLHASLRLFAALLLASACGNATEAPEVSAALDFDGRGLAQVTNDLGYAITLSEFRLIVADFEFAVADEAQSASAFDRVGEWLLPLAHAHSGPVSGGEVTGALPGRFVLAWPAGEGARLGSARLQAGNYRSANFRFVRGGLIDGLSDTNPLFGHTAVLRGNAARGATEIGFELVVDSPEGRALDGAAFELQVEPGDAPELSFAPALAAPLGDTLFDGVDFEALSAAAPGPLRLTSTATVSEWVVSYNELRQAFQDHDYFVVRARAP